ncbi:Ribonuclease 3 [Prochlorococcus marinus str. MIT 1342]|nr:Ribonuclease 3 [Prochlorococcus marinus str. MIT 1342]
MTSRSSRLLSQKRTTQLLELLTRIGLSPTNADNGPGADPSSLIILDEALTHTSAQKRVNHERLEFLGDAVLRLAASEYIELNFPHMDVGERSALRAQLVSDRWLTKVGQSIGIETVLILGAKAAGDASAKATLQAEATEAFIGALYEYWKSLEPIHHWLTPHWQEATCAFLADPHRLNSKSALQEWSQARGLGLPRYKCEERSTQHGDPQRYFCKVHLDDRPIGEGWGGSRRNAEQKAARQSLQALNKSATDN